MAKEKISGYYTRPTQENGKTIIRDYAQDSQGTWYTRTPESNISKAWRLLTGEYPEKQDNGDITLYVDGLGNVKLSYVAKSVQLPMPVIPEEFDFDVDSLDLTTEEPIETNPIVATTTTTMTKSEAYEKHTELKVLFGFMRKGLLEMRDRKGYLHLGYTSFEEYGEQEWNYSKSQINRLATAEVIQQSLSLTDDKEIPESQLRPLGKVPAAIRNEIYQQAKADAEAEGKEVTAKKIAEGVAEYKATAEKQKREVLEELKKHKSIESALERNNKELRDELKTTKAIADTSMTKESEVRDQLQQLQSTTDETAVKIAEDKIAEIQQKMQAELDKTIATLDADYQAKIDSQKDKISNLENILTKIKQTSATNEQDTAYLADLHQEIDQAKAVLKQLSLDEKEAADAKRTNHFYVGIATALSRDVHDHIENLNANSRSDDNGNVFPVCPLTDTSKDYLNEVARVLHNAAKFLETLAAYTENNHDDIDEIYQAMAGFFTHWKNFRNALYKPEESNGYNCWFNWLEQDNDESLNNKMIEMFPKIWERYQLEIQAIN
jgi:hypothetical protein